MPATSTVDAGRSWLAYWSPDPGECLAAWDGGGLAAIPMGAFWVVQTSATLGLRAVQVLPQCGPVLHSVVGATVEFLVAPPTAPLRSGWRGIGRVLDRGVLPCPAPGAAAPSTPGGLPVRRAAKWVVEPDGSGRLLALDEVLGALSEDYERVVARDGERECAGAVGSARPLAAGAFLRAARRPV
ncbi:hypothetical protein [Streptomyces sp. MJM8645]|uniref:hypothetical protein n=1 Tax=Streptomycetaceae TaxID=2062 RepID=UPI0013315E0B|nr:hypothetical protein [Streptomyces sp. MJM8645]